VHCLRREPRTGDKLRLRIAINFAQGKDPSCDIRQRANSRNKQAQVILHRDNLGGTHFLSICPEGATTGAIHGCIRRTKCVHHDLSQRTENELFQVRQGEG